MSGETQTDQKSCWCYQNSLQVKKRFLVNLNKILYNNYNFRFLDSLSHQTFDWFSQISLFAHLFYLHNFTETVGKGNTSLLSRSLDAIIRKVAWEKTIPCLECGTLRFIPIFMIAKRLKDTSREKERENEGVTEKGRASTALSFCFLFFAYQVVSGCTIIRDIDCPCIILSPCAMCDAEHFRG